MKIVCTNRQARSVGNQLWTSGSVGVTVDFEFSEHWNNLNKTVVFKGSGTTKDVVLTGNSCVIPHEVMANYGGFLIVGVYGFKTVNNVNEIVIPTVYVNLGKIEAGANPSGDESLPVTPTVAEQIQAIAQSVRDDADAGEFDGEDGADGISCTHSWTGTTLNITSASGASSADLKGEQGIQGETGADGYTPVRGTDYWTSEDIATIDTYIDSRTEGMASQSALDTTNDRLNLLYDLTRGTAWRIDNSEASSYAEAVPSGSHYADVLSVGGKSMVWNQLVGESAESVTLKSSHKYLTSIGGTKSIQTGSGNAISVTGGTDMVIDLTVLYGSGNEPSTVAQFEAVFPSAYYPYSAPTIIHAAVDKVVERGANIWNEQWELGSYDSTGNAEAATNTIRSKANSYIDVSPSTDYYFIFPSGCAIVVFWYDANKAFISNNTRSSNTSITAPSNARYIRFRLSTQYGTTYNNDIAIIKGTSGSYAPYHSVDHPIPSSITSLTGYGWGIGSVRNEVDFANGVYRQRVGRVDLSTFSDYNEQLHSWHKVVDFAEGSSNAITEKYTYDSAFSHYSSGEYSNIFRLGASAMGNYWKNRALVCNGSSTERPSGYMYYELTTPIETSITDSLDFAVEGGGSLTFHHAEGDGGKLIPTAHSVDYYRNVAEAI